MRNLLTLAALVAVCLSAQPPEGKRPAFEVASVKQHPKAVGATASFRLPGSIPYQISGNRVASHFVSVHDMIMDAYEVKDHQVLNLPDWTTGVGADRFDIDARAEGAGAPTMPQVRLMMRALLADRFHLKIHSESREMTVYNLVVLKSGSKLREVRPDEPKKEAKAPSGTTAFRSGADGPRTMISNLPTLLWLLANTTDRPIVDKTGLTGTYEYTNLDWRGLALANRNQTDDNGPSISVFTAVQRELGLKLEPVKGPFAVWVVDHVEKPTEN